MQQLMWELDIVNGAHLIMGVFRIFRDAASAIIASILASFTHLSSSNGAKWFLFKEPAECTCWAFAEFHCGPAEGLRQGRHTVPTQDVLCAGLHHCVAQSCGQLPRGDNGKGF